MLIAQISDIHCGAAGAAARLQETVSALAALDPAPDLLLLTGDLAEYGQTRDYAELHKAFAAFPIQILPIPGNHDRRDAFRAAFANYGFAFGPHDFCQYAKDFYALRIIGLDTVREDSDEPELCATRLNWLKRELHGGGAPVLIAMHHPPFQTGVRWVDAREPSWSDALGDIVETAQTSIAGIVCGHVHRPIFRNWRSVPVISAPAVAPQVKLEFDANQTGRYSGEPPGFLLHRWDGKTLTSYAASASGFAMSTRFGAMNGDAQAGAANTSGKAGA
ncbi:MAG: metallophosphoesterase [Amphiplicatus sp.]